MADDMFSVPTSEAHRIECIKCKQKTSAATPICKQCSRNQPSTASDNSHLVENIERSPVCQESTTPNQGVQEQSDLKNTAEINITTNKEILPSSDCYELKRKSEDNYSSEGGSLQVVKENVANPGPSGNTTDIGNLASTDCNELKRKSEDNYSSEGGSISILKKLLAKPGPSGFHKKSNATSVSNKKIRSISPSKLMSEDPKKMKCFLCKDGIPNHRTTKYSKNFYRCCVCKIRSDGRKVFLLHLQKHYRDYLRCKICSEMIWDVKAHGVERTCKACQITFQCRTLLENHCFVVHEKQRHYRKKCIMCNSEIYKHFDEEIRKYKCCVCDRFRRPLKWWLLKHLNTHHDLELFKCSRCDKRYRHIQRLKKHERACFK